MAKSAVSFRLSNEVRAMIRALARRFDVSDRDAVETAVREKIKREKISAATIIEQAEALDK